MKIALISVDQELFCVGLRLLSAVLRRGGHDVRCIFLPPGPPSHGQPAPASCYSARLLDGVAALCADADLVGISLMTNQFMHAIAITEHLKQSQIQARVIWGGVHPTVEPEACLEYADIVCVGEGDEALLELADRMAAGSPYLETRNMWFRTGGQIIRNPLRPLLQDLDSLPFPDYSCQDHYLGFGSVVEPLTPERLRGFVGQRFRHQQEALQYPIMTSRGCPYACTYCCNSAYSRLYPHQRRLRWRSAGSVIGELNYVREALGPLSLVFMVDDNFTARKESELAEFCARYRAEIHVPFACQCSPLTISQGKIDLLLQAGCVKLVMGVETASERVAGMYNRSHLHKALPKAIALIESYRHAMPQPPTYQFIIDNPYETLEETLETLRLALSLKRPWDNPIYSLMLFPGTPLYGRALQDGLIRDKTTEIYAKDWHDHSIPFYRFWVRLYRSNRGAPLLRFMLLPVVARCLTGRIADRLWRLPGIQAIWDRKATRQHASKS